MENIVFHTHSTHPNKGTLLFTEFKGIALDYHVNNQVAPGIASNLPTVYDCEALNWKKFNSLQELANAYYKEKKEHITNIQNVLTIYPNAKLEVNSSPLKTEDYTFCIVQKPEKFSDAFKDFDFHLSDYTNSIENAWKNAEKHITKNLKKIIGHPELHKTSFLLNLSETQYNKHLSKLDIEYGDAKNKVENLNNLIELYSNDEYSNLYDKSLQEKNLETFKVDFFQESIIKSKEIYNTLGFDNLDFDNDGLTNAEEINLGTSLYNKDTDGNGITDVNEPSIPKNQKLPEGTAFRIVEDKKEGSYKIEKAHKILKWINVRPSKKNGIDKTSGLTKDQAFETYTKMQKLDIEKNQKKGKGFKL